MIHRARKRFGQHFLSDEAVIEQIIRAINPQQNDNIVEIGPGLSAITEPLLLKTDHLTVVEIDRDLVLNLNSSYPAHKLTVINADALTVNFNELGKNLRLVGNLPYNISSPLLFHLVQYADNIIDQHFMLQREVIMRMTAKPSSADYGRLSVMLQSRYKMHHLFDVAPDSFDPPPKVMSAVVRMLPLPESRPKPINHDLFADVVTKSFSQRRKMLRRSLAEWTDKINWHSIDIDPSCRAQDLSVQQFVRLSDHLHENLDSVKD